MRWSASWGGGDARFDSDRCRLNGLTDYPPETAVSAEGPRKSETTGGSECMNHAEVVHQGLLS